MKKPSVARAAVFATAFFAAALGAGHGAGAGELVVRVEGLRNGDGLVHFALYDRADGFPDSDARIAGGRTATVAGGTEYVFADLPAGRYAISVFHDENANGEFDQNFIGWPKEGFGFGNDAMGLLSAPSFAEAAISVGEGSTRTVVTLNYW